MGSLCKTRGLVPPGSFQLGSIIFWCLNMFLCNIYDKVCISDYIVSVALYSSDATYIRTPFIRTLWGFPVYEKAESPDQQTQWLKMAP